MQKVMHLATEKFLKYGHDIKSEYLPIENKLLSFVVTQPHPLSKISIKV